MKLASLASRFFAPPKSSDIVQVAGSSAPVSVGRAGESVSETSALGLSAAWACGNLIAGTISSVPFEVYRRDSGGQKIIDERDTLFQTLARFPNAEQSALDFWDGMVLSVEFHGNAYARISRMNGKVIGLYQIKPQNMRVRRDAAGVIVYEWSENGRRYTGTAADVFHIRGPGGDALGGLSTLKIGRDVFSAALAADRAAASMFRNGLRPSALIRFKEWLTPQQRDIVQSDLVEKYMGAMNAGRPFVTEGDVEFDQITISPEDAQMLETRNFGIEEVCRLFGVPPVMIGHAGGSTAWPTSVEAQVLVFQKFTLRRRLKRIEQAVRQQLIGRDASMDGVTAEFNMEGLLRGDSASRAAFYQSGLQNGWITINEVRAKENMRAVEGGDVPRMQMQNVPITDVGGNAASNGG